MTKKQPTPTNSTTTTSEPTPLALYNFRSRSLEQFASTGPVGLYSCGPTVYNDVHIGNLRTFIFEDILRRTLRHLGYSVKQVMNITDVDDKIIGAAAAAKVSIQEFTQPYFASFFRDIRAVGIEPADSYPRATDHIEAMINLIDRLLKKGIAYIVNGSVYFSIAEFPRYGQLSGIDRRQLKPGSRVDSDEYDKEAVEDFALWKASKPVDEEVGAVWDSPWGRGRPGWHIECSAMSMAELGETFDLHAGAIDLLFPHHEDELAQAEAATGTSFARFFLEAEHLLVDGKKMAKSLGNFTTLREIEARKIDPLAFRYLALQAHYRAKLNFTWESLAAAARTLANLRELQYRPGHPPELATVKRIDAALANDLDTPTALAILHEANDPTLWAKYDAVFGLGLQIETVIPDQTVAQLVRAREAARQAKDFREADRLRQELKTLGWDIEDTPAGPRFIPRSPSSFLP